MSFVYLSGEITHTGTDSTLSGLDGVTGVEAWPEGIRKCYRIDDAVVSQFKLNGDLTWDSDYECLFLDEHVKVIQSGAVQMGISKTKNGKEYYSRGLGLVINDLGGKQNTSQAAWWCLNDSSFTTRGGVIDLGANIFFGTSTVSSATINQYVTVDIDGTDFNSLYGNDGMHFLRFFVNPATIDVNNIGMSGSEGSISPFSSEGFNSFSATIHNGTFSSDGNAGQATVVIKNTAVADNLANYLFKARGNNLYNKWEFNNLDVGSAINGTTEKNAGISDATSDIQVKLIAEDYTGIEGAIGFMTLAGGTTVMDPSVGNYATAYRDYTADQEFVMITDVNGESSIEKVLLGVLHASDNANGQEMALETFTSLPLDFEEVVFLAFGFLPKKKVYELKGIGVNILDNTLFPNTALTETSRAVIDAYNLLSNGERIHDRLHSMKTVPDTSIASFPDYETPFVTAVGTFLDFGDIACFIADSGDTAVITTDNTDIIGIIDNVPNIVGSVRMNCGDKLTPTSGGFNGVMSRTGIVVDGSTDIDGWAAAGDLYINNANDITDVPVSGDLYIDTKTGQNEVVSYANVKVSGVVYNPSLYNIEIQADANCQLTADNPGTGAGQVNIVEPLVTLSVSGMVDGTEVRVYKKSDDSELIGVESSTGGIYTQEYDYTGVVVVIAHHIYYKYVSFEYTLTGLTTDIPIIQEYDPTYRNP